VGDTEGAVIARPTRVLADSGDPALEAVAEQLRDLLGPWVQRTPPSPADGGPAPAPPPGRADSLAVDVLLTLRGADPSLGLEGYELEASPDGITIRGNTAAGVFHGVQTLRQLLPPEVEYTGAFRRPWTVPAVMIRDAPRFGWRGAMLDVARHFRTVEEVKRFIDLMVPYKLNRLHLHLSDDQGWRVEIPGWPELTRIGGSTEVGGGPGGYYTLAEYEEIVAYAAARYIAVVPEIDVPGHTNAALASVPELNCDDTAREIYTGVAVGFSVLCIERESTWEFLDDVVREIAARTPGPWFHMGGDEVEELTEEEYADFVLRMEALIRSHGKRMIGWDEVAMAEVGEPSVVQLWRPFWSEDLALQGQGAARAQRLRDGVQAAVERGARVVLSPADRLYLDMKYEPRTVLGLRWAGLVDERRAYHWSVAETFSGIPEEAILGVEAPLWSETIGSIHDLEYLAFPRLAAVAEIGWSPQPSRSEWWRFRDRLAAQGPRWTAQGVNFRRSPGIPWPADR
jgi:hexosaminidase